jgi:hypothetical protein
MERFLRYVERAVRNEMAKRPAARDIFTLGNGRMIEFKLSKETRGKTTCS